MHWDGTITLGNLLTIGVSALAVIRAWFVIDAKLSMMSAVMGARLANIEEWIKGHEECSHQQREILDEVRAGLSYLRGVASQRRFADRHNDRSEDE